MNGLCPVCRREETLQFVTLRIDLGKVVGRLYPVAPGNPIQAHNLACASCWQDLLKVVVE